MSICKISLFGLLLCGLLLSWSCNFGMEHAHCDDTALARIPSPDGSLEIATFHRTCSLDTSRMTYATVEKKSGFLRSKGEQHCYLMTWTKYHPIEAVWLDPTHIKIGTSDELGENDVISRYDDCQDIKVTYEVKSKPPAPISSKSPQIAADLATILAATESCMRKWDSSLVDQMVYRPLSAGNQRDALSFIFVYVWNGHCSLSRNTFELMKQTAIALQLEPGNWELVENQVED